MARDFNTGVIDHKPARMHRTLIAEQICRMGHLQVDYTVKGAVEPKVARRPGGKKVVGLHSDAYIISAADLSTPESDGGMMASDESYRDFIRLICVRNKIKRGKPGKRGYIVDASHLELGADSLIEDRFESDDWDYDEDGKPLKVIDVIYNSLELAQAEVSLEEQYGLVLPESVLWIMRREDESS